MEKRKISARIVADSIDPRGNRITSYILTYPRMIHSELLTHRMFSRNAASSRAIPFEKMVKDVENDPFIPIAWQRDHKGMQGTEYFTDPLEIETCELEWLKAASDAVRNAKRLNTNGNDVGVTKQLCNRLLEPFQWYTTLVTATEYDNFFELRCPKYEHDNPSPTLRMNEGKLFRSSKDKIASMQYPDYVVLNFTEKSGRILNIPVKDATQSDWLRTSKSGAEIHIQALAEAMWDAKNDSTPKELGPGEWHIPFGDRMTDIIKNLVPHDHIDREIELIRLKVASARCARLSYNTFDGEINYEKDIKLHDMLLSSKHMSPFEHCARVATESEYYNNVRGTVKEIYDDAGSIESLDWSDGAGWFNNFRGFIPYRYLLENKKEV